MIGGQITYGLYNETLLHVAEAERGLACACICPCCRRPLIARKGRIVAHHFAHVGEPCQYGQETALHLAAKEILSQTGYIVLPAVLPPMGNVRLAEETSFEVERADLEHRLGCIVPDVVLHIRGKQLLIEVTVTHGIDEKKYAEIRRLGISTVEIDLRDAPRDWNLDELRSVIVDSSPRKKWIFNSYAESLPNSRKMVVVPRGYALHVDGCPISARVWRGKAYANVIDDCSCCPYLMAYAPGNVAMGDAQFPDNGERGGVIYCTGHVVNQSKVKSPNRGRV